MYEERIEELPLIVDGRRICGTLHTPVDGCDVHPLVIMSHGFSGAHWSNDQFASDFVQAGYMAYGFDFCGSARSRSDGNPLENSVLTEADDLNGVMDALLQRPDVDRSRVCLFGRSQGGFVSSYVAAQRPDDVRALVVFFPAFVLQDDARKRADDQGTFPETSEIMGVVSQWGRSILTHFSNAMCPLTSNKKMSQNATSPLTHSYSMSAMS